MLLEMPLCDGILSTCMDSKQVDDKYGSPTIDEITEFSREFQSQLEEELGEEEAGHISVEVSSPVRFYPQLLRSPKGWQI